ncbi:hypothetical protein C0Q70_01564 [Pomacea canaliculata]|uniref:Uncharacterized protein n=1 Tax=Pomacea canaliculata TaxID=400727 RepID=A0A2T7PZV1_POMCA|nr:hypothetical protein C0Q70_01564 [Pomacea canaliculata]
MTTIFTSTSSQYVLEHQHRRPSHTDHPETLHHHPHPHPHQEQHYAHEKRGSHDQEDLHHQVHHHHHHHHHGHQPHREVTYAPTLFPSPPPTDPTRRIARARHIHAHTQSTVPLPTVNSNFIED